MVVSQQLKTRAQLPGLYYPKANSVRIINAHRGSGGGTGLTTNLLHWWSLHDDGVWSDDVGGWSLSEGGTVTVSSSGGPGSKDAADFDRGEYLHRSDVAWDGASDAMSLSLWWRSDSLGSSIGNWLFNWRSVGAIFVNAFHRNSDNVIRVAIGDGTTSTSMNGPAIALSEWHNFVLTSDGASDHKLYVDGTEQATSTTTLSGITASALPFAFATTAWSKGLSDNSHDGRLWGCGIWDRQLSASDASALYNGGSGLDYGDF